MAPMMLLESRVQALNANPVLAGKYVLYWMQQSQRLHWNMALEHAIVLANGLHLPVLVCFGITPSFPEANLRHYHFMFEGLEEIASAAPKRGLGFVAAVGSPDEVCVHYARHAAMVVVDAGYLRIQRQWRSSAAKRVACRMVEVESDVVVPVRVVSDKEEYAAATLRPKIHRLLAQYLQPLVEQTVRVPYGSSCGIASTTAEDLRRIFVSLPVDRSVPPVEGITGGTSAALQKLETFCTKLLPQYAERRNDPTQNATSGLSPYLHFGHIAPLYVAWRVTQEPHAASRDAFLEELIVRRELAMNFVYYNDRYDQYDGIPKWARETLDKHRNDRRPFIYSCEELEEGKTHDPIWNACQQELRYFGTIPNYLRMYWGKKIIEWTPSPEAAFRIALYLNNKYQLDGRDPNSFAGVAWCFGKHDRPWAERPIFGTVRYMNDGGLRRKFPIAKYVAQVTKRVAELLYEKTGECKPCDE